MDLELYNRIKEKHSDSCLICLLSRKLSLSLSKLDPQGKFSYIRRTLETNKSKIKFCTCPTYTKVKNFICDWSNKTLNKREYLKYLIDDIILTVVKNDCDVKTFELLLSKTYLFYYGDIFEVVLGTIAEKNRLDLLFFLLDNNALCRENVLKHVSWKRQSTYNESYEMIHALYNVNAYPSLHNRSDTTRIIDKIRQKYYN